jgi:Double zinc ribbon/Zn-finger in Ran binding protein and others
MTKKTIGFVELEWTCPNCGNKNPGLKKTCATCGAPQPESVQFEVGQKADLISDAQKNADAAKGADIYCPFCHTRNTADAQVCIQCGGDLKEGNRRESGQVMSAAPMGTEAPIKCPGCGTINPPGAKTCSACGTALKAAENPTNEQINMPAPKPASFHLWLLLPIGALLMLVCVIIGFVLFRTTTLSGVVQKLEWQRSIAIEAQQQVTKETWRDQIPANDKVLACQQKYRSREDKPVAGATEVCTTQLVDQGNGAARVDETCYYEVYFDYCQYQTLEWQTVQQTLAKGADLKPYWPQVTLVNGQREGQRTETYTAYFDTKDGVKPYTTSDAGLFSQLQPGSEWLLSVNTLGAIIEISPPE